eukprot:scaffold6292_cov49-Phaeocystis_antarctica.AAC.2
MSPIIIAPGGGMAAVVAGAGASPKSPSRSSPIMPPIIMSPMAPGGGIAAADAGASLKSPSRSPSRSTGGAVATSADGVGASTCATGAARLCFSLSSPSDSNEKFRVTEPSVQASTFSFTTSVAIDLTAGKRADPACFNTAPRKPSPAAASSRLQRAHTATTALVLDMSGQKWLGT